MALETVTALCLQTDVENILSISGVKTRLDQAMDSYVTAREQEVMTEAIIYASEICYMYLLSRYTVEKLATSNLVKRWCACIAAFVVAGVCGNPAPMMLTNFAEDAEAKMDAIGSGKNPRGLPGIGQRRTHGPVFDIVRVDPRYTFKCLRVETARSSQAPTAMPVIQDYASSWSWEI